MVTLHGVQNRAIEWAYASGEDYRDPFNDVELDIVVTDQQGRELRVPAYWAGGGEWRVRFAPRLAGTHRFRTVCSNSGDTSLHGQAGVLEVRPAEGPDPLAARGPLRASADRRHLELADGTPFFWLADTWWMGLCSRLRWPDEFQTLVADRVEKGFTVIQIVAGPYPDMDAFDPRNANEAGQPWQPGFERVNPAYFDMADLRIQWLVRSGLVPCIVGCWGYHLKAMGADKVKKHWRYLVARYGAYPVVWCLAGEATMPFYLSKSRPDDERLLKRGWTEVAGYVRGLDPYGHPVTIHPTVRGRDQIDDPKLLDLEMLQTGHSGLASFGPTMTLLTEALGREPRMPVIDAEVNYEGIFEDSREEVQRLMFWSCMLSGAAGHTYGANGLWQLNQSGRAYGASPHGGNYGEVPWEEACRLPGSRQLGLGRRILERYRWWRFESRPDWIAPCASRETPLAPYAAGIPGEVRVFYLPNPPPPPGGPGRSTVKALEPGRAYRAAFVNPKTGAEVSLGEVRGDSRGDWPTPMRPVMHDWLLVLEAP
jgi:hypothetical protein